MAEGFAKAVLDGGPVPFPPMDAVQNMRVLDAIAASAQSGRRIELVGCGGTRLNGRMSEAVQAFFARAG